MSSHIVRQLLQSLGDDDVDDIDENGQDTSLPLMRRIVKRDRTSPGLAGSLSGALGAIAMVFATDAVMHAMHFGTDAHPFLSLLARLAQPFVSNEPPWPMVAGAGCAAVLGAIVGSFFARLTRRLEKLVPLLFFAHVSFAALWILIDALLVTRFPHVAAELPFVPLLVGTQAFALVSCFELPVRLGRGIAVGPKRKRVDDEL